MCSPIARDPHCGHKHSLLLCESRLVPGPVLARQPATVAGPLEALRLVRALHCAMEWLRQLTTYLGAIAQLRDIAALLWLPKLRRCFQCDDGDFPRTDPTKGLPAIWLP